MNQPDQQPHDGPKVYIGLEGVHVEFPEGYWDDPSHDVRLADGRSMRQARIEGLGLLITQALRKQLAQRQRPAGLLGPDGRPISG